jgi:hypothetical protein
LQRPEDAYVLTRRPPRLRPAPQPETGSRNGLSRSRRRP